MQFAKLSRQIALGLGLFAGMVAGAGAQTIKVGVIAALTGGAAQWGMAAAEGVKLAAAEVNAKGGLDVAGKKQKVEVVAYDDQYKAADAVAAYNRLTKQDGAKYVVILSSSGTMALKQAVEDDKVIGLSSSYSSKAIDKDSKYMFRVYSAPWDYLPPMISWMKGRYKERKVFILNPNDETGWDLTNIGGKYFKENGFEIIGQDLYERSVKDFQPILTKIVAAKPEIIDLGGTAPATAGLIMRQAREIGYRGLFMKTGGAGPREIVAGAGKEAAENMVSVLYADPANDGYKRLAADYQKSVGQPPNEIIVAFYDSAKVLFSAISKAGDARDTAKVAAAFPKALPMNSVQGDPMTLGGKAASGVDQQIMTTMYIGVIKNGEPVVIGKAK